MAQKKGNAKGGKEEKKQKTVKKQYQLSNLYEIQGDKLVRKNRFSPKSPGDFMANHNDRTVCGKTGYTEYKKKN